MRSRTVHRWAARGGAAAFTAVALVIGTLAAATGAAQAAAQPRPSGLQHVTGHLYPVPGHHDYAAACARRPKAGHMTCLALVRTNVKPRPNNAHPDAIPAGVGYGPSSLQSAYVLPSSTAGSGQTVAVVDAYNDPNAASDLATYRSAAGLPACGTGCFSVVNENGAASPLPSNAGSTRLGRRGVAGHRHGVGDLPAVPHHPGRGEQRRPPPTWAPR